MILLFLLPKMEKAFLLVDCGADLSRHIAGGIDGGTEGIPPSGSFERITVSPLEWDEETFSTENAARMASLMCASHIEQAMPETLTVVWIIFVPPVPGIFHAPFFGTPL